MLALHRVFELTELSQAFIVWLSFSGHIARIRDMTHHWPMMQWIYWSPRWSHLCVQLTCSKIGPLKLLHSAPLCNCTISNQQIFRQEGHMAIWELLYDLSLLSFICLLLCIFHISVCLHVYKSMRSFYCAHTWWGNAKFWVTVTGCA